MSFYCNLNIEYFPVKPISQFWGAIKKCWKKDKNLENYRKQFLKKIKDYVELNCEKVIIYIHSASFVSTKVSHM